MAEIIEMSCGSGKTLERRWIPFDCDTWECSECKIVIIAIIAILAAIIYGVIVSCLNERNRITEGVIVDKSYTAESVITRYEIIGDTQTPYTDIEPAHYHFKLEGEKDEIKVRYWLEVSEHDYNEYKIGDYYKL